jgi:hypothetical protein
MALALVPRAFSFHSATDEDEAIFDSSGDCLAWLKGDLAAPGATFSAEFSAI